MSDRDRKEILTVMEKMFDEVDDCGIYNTTVAYKELEELIEKARYEAADWAFSEACAEVDAGRDPREYNFGGLVNRIKQDLET